KLREEKARAELIEVEDQAPQNGHVDKGHDQGRSDQNVGRRRTGEGATSQQLARNQRFEPAELSPPIERERGHGSEAGRHKELIRRAVLRVVGVKREHQQAEAEAEKSRAEPVDRRTRGARRKLAAPR